MKKTIIILVVFVALVIGVFYFLNSSLISKESSLITGKSVKIGFSMGTTREERWFRDRDFFVQKAQELGATVNVTFSDYDVEKQIMQIENLISQGSDVIVIIPSDSEKLAPAITKANQAGVKVIAYDRLIKNSDIDLYLSYDNVKVGKLQAESILEVKDSGNFAYIGGSPTDNNAILLKQGSMNVLSSKIKSGEITLVLDTFSEAWKPEEAFKAIDTYLTSGKTLDAVVAANDGTATGVIQALKKHNLDGKIPVSGQDAELSATQRIIAGTQTSTVYKPIPSLAYKAVELAILLGTGKTPETTSFIDNGKLLVPSFLLDPVTVNKKNMVSTIVKDGFHTYEQIYQETAK